MIPTGCPYGHDTRMCAYCSKKDTCSCRCDVPKCDIIWGEITGNIADQTDLSAELKTIRDSIVSASSYSQVQLSIKDQNLYVVAPVGLLNADTDKPVFARYVSSNIRGNETNSKNRRIHYKRKGWIRPTNNQLGKKYPLVPLIMEKVTQWDSDKYDYFVIKSGASDYQNESRTYTSIGKDLYNARAKQHTIDLYIANRKLGIGIERDGVLITDYMPFALREESIRVNGKLVDTYVLSRCTVIGIRYKT